MTDVVLFHHVLGLTDGVGDFAERLGGGRHTVHTPDLYGGKTAATFDDGFALKERIGERALAARIEEAVIDMPPTMTFAGISLGAMAAQRLAQTRRGTVGLLLYAGCAPMTGEYASGPWPHRLPVQIHGMDQDPFFAGEGDIDAARELVGIVGEQRAELYTYPGDGHLFLDSSFHEYDSHATDLVVERSLEFLDRLAQS
jgi:dienelactone hydrolase